jgi:hypothetical protein
MREHRLEFTASENPWGPTAVVAEINERTGSGLALVGLAEQASGFGGRGCQRDAETHDDRRRRGQSRSGQGPQPPLGDSRRTPRPSRIRPGSLLQTRAARTPGAEDD